MFKKVKDNKTSNKVFTLLSYVLVVINIFFFFFIRPEFQLKNFVYKISNFEIIISKEIFSDYAVFEIPIWLKLLVSLSFFSILASLFFLYKGKNREFLFLSLPMNFFPIYFFILESVVPEFKSINYGLIFLYLIFSLLSTFFFLCSSGLEFAFRNLFRSIATLCILILFLIIFYLVASGIPAISKIGIFNFIFGLNWVPSKGIFGILPFICCSLVVTFGSFLIGVPMGVLTAIFLSEFSHPFLAKVINFFIKLLAGIPSVVFGFFGMFVVIPMIRNVFYKYTTGDCLLSAIIILSIMILPTIVSISESAIKSASKKYLEASIALGESKARSIFKVVIPAAKNGIVSSAFLGLGKALGETMAVIMVSGNSVNMPNLLKSSRFLTTAMALEFSYASGIHKQALFSIGLVLFIIIFLVNMAFVKFLKKENE